MDTEPVQASLTFANLGPWILSAIALLQTWVIAFLQRIRKPEVAIYESGTIELGYSTYGPTVGLTGTLRGLRKDSYVTRISVTITRQRDSAQHVLSWRFFRSSTITPSQSDPVRLEIASAFCLTENNPFRYNILFVDETFIAEISPKVGHIPAKWSAFRNSKIQEFEHQHGADTLAAVMNNPMVYETLFDEFLKDPEVLNVYTILDRGIYWEAGSYALRLSVECSRPDANFSREFSFDISDNDAQLLRQNTIQTLRTFCGLGAVWNFAYPKYNS